MNKNIKAYADGREWNDGQRERVNDALNRCREALDVDDLYQIRHEVVCLVDYVFPTGFIYTSNQGPSEPLTGAYMKGGER